MRECVFCRIISGAMPSATVFNDENTIAFMDLSPANKGHVLVMLKKHYETFQDIPAAEMTVLSDAVRKVAAAVVKATKADGFNLLMSNGKAAGQTVPHAHMHVIPRFDGDGIGLNWTQKKYGENEMADYGDRIKKALRTFSYP